MSFLQRLMLLVLLLIIPILSVEITNNVYLKNERVAAIHDEAERLAALVDDEHARLVEGIRQLLSTWAESSALRDARHGGLPGDGRAAPRELSRLSGDHRNR